MVDAKHQDAVNIDIISREIAEIIEYCSPVVFEMPDIWVEHSIDLSRDNTSAATGLVDLSATPYLRDPLNFWARDRGGKMTVMAVEQTGKSSVWKWGMLWSMVHKPSSSLIVYPSDKDATDTNTDSLEPLMGGIDKLRSELERPKSKRKDCYRFSAMSCYFTGAGNDIISKPLRIVVGDEPDFWIKYNEKVSNVDNLDKRGRTFPDALRVLVCSPTAEGGLIYQEFLQSSQGFWHLKCMGCGGMIRSADIHNLQWELDSSENIIEESLLLKCPECGHEHTEDCRVELTLNGAYLHKYPERIERHVGFQWGVLAATFESRQLSWLGVAEAQMAAGKNAEVKKQKTLDNSFRGLPFRPRKSNRRQIDQIRRHCDSLPSIDQIENVFFVADTQDTGWWWIIRAVDSSSNTYLLDYGFAENLMELDKVWEGEYLGLQPVIGLIDEGGHRKKELEPWVSERRGLFTYKGDNRGSERWRFSENHDDLILAKEKLYQGDLLYYIYSQDSRTNNYWYLLPDISDEYVDMIADIAPNKNVRGGDQFENYISRTGNDHLFDCEKMFLVLLEFAVFDFPHKLWRIGKLDGINPPPKEKKTSGSQKKTGWMSKFK